MSNLGPTPPNDPYQPPQPPQAPYNGQQWPQQAQGGYSNSPYQNQNPNQQPEEDKGKKIAMIAGAVAVLIALIVAAVFAIPALGKKDGENVPVPSPTSSSTPDKSEAPTDESTEDPFAEETTAPSEEYSDDYYLPTSLSSYPYEEYVSLKVSDEAYVAKIKETAKNSVMTGEEILYTSHNICYALDNGVSIDKTIKHFVTLSREASVPDYEMGVVFGGSVGVYCDSHLKDVQTYLDSTKSPAKTS